MALMHDVQHDTPAAEPEVARAARDDAPSDGPSDGPAAQPAPGPRPRPKSSYELPTRQNTVLRNILWALGLTMAVVVVMAVAFFGVGADLEREPLENSEVDVAASAERAQDLAAFPVAAPAPGEAWAERSARFTDGQNQRWQVQYSSPSGAHVTLTQEGELSAPMLSAALPGAAVQEDLEIEGTTCQVLAGGDEDDRTGIACEGEGFGLVVAGTADRAELEELTAAALTSTRG